MRKYLKFTILCLLAALILWWFGRDLDWAAVRTALAQSDGRLIAAAIAVVCLSYLVRAYRWRTLLAPLAPATLRELFAATTMGFGAVFLIGRAGEVVRPAFLVLRERRVRPGASFVTIALERIYDLVAVIVLFAANLLWFRAPGADPSSYARVREAGWILFMAAVAGIIGLVWFKRHAHDFIRWLDGQLAQAPALVQRVGRVLMGVLEQVAGALRVLVDVRELAVTVGWTICLWAGITLAYWLVLRAFGLGFGLSETVFVMGWALVGSLVPTPGGAAGAFHAATAAGMIFLGVARERAAAASIVLHLVAFGPALFFGVYYFLRSDVEVGRLRQLAVSEKAGEDAVEEKGIGSSVAAERRA